MSKSPGHREHPEHKVEETPAKQTMRVVVDDEIVAESNDVVKLEEDGHPDRYYFPRSDVRMDMLERTATTSECPFKGRASYYTLRAGKRSLDDAVWTYEEPYDEHQGLKGRLAFLDDSFPEIKVRVTDRASPGR